MAWILIPKRRSVQTLPSAVSVALAMGPRHGVAPTSVSSTWSVAEFDASDRPALSSSRVDRPLL